MNSQVNMDNFQKNINIPKSSNNLTKEEKEEQTETNLRNLLTELSNIKLILPNIEFRMTPETQDSKKINLRIPKSKDKDTNMKESGNSIGEEIMYGDIWNKEDYLNWLYTRLLAIREVMSDNASIYVHLDYNIGHYVKVIYIRIYG